MPLAPQSQTSIVNAALTRLGSTERVTSIDGGATVAKPASALWDQLLRDALTYPWNFATRTARLNPTVVADKRGYARAFTLPADCLRWLPPVPEDDAVEAGAWFEGVQEGRLILTDAGAPLRVRYISSSVADDPAQWPADFAEAFSLQLAWDMAEPLTASQGIKDRLEVRAKEAWAKAKRHDAATSPRTGREAVTVRSSWLQAMHRPYNYRGR